MGSMDKTPRENIIRLLKEKSSMKQDVFFRTIDTFHIFRDVIKELAATLKAEAAKIDQRILVDTKDKSEFETELRVAGDILIFHMHTNVFEFDKSHPLWKTSYVKENPERSFCG